MKKSLPATSIVLSLLLCAGCTTHRVHQFRTFANAGMKYSDAVFALTEATANTAIEANSSTLIYSRDYWSYEIREKKYLQLTKSLTGLLEELRAFRTHTKLLQAYFKNLSLLAETDAPSSIGHETENLVQSMQHLGGQLEQATSVKTFMGSAAKLIVANYKQKALEQELRKHANILERELELQRAYLQALAEGMLSDSEYLREMRQTKIVSSYVEDGALDENWANERRDLLKAETTIDILVSATTAARNLKATFVSLVENNVQPGDFDALFSSIDEIIAFLETARSHKNP